MILIQGGGHHRPYVRCAMKESRTRVLMLGFLPPLPADLALFSPDDTVPVVARASSGYFHISADLGAGICRSGDIIDALCVAVTAVLEGEHITGECLLVGEASAL